MIITEKRKCAGMPLLRETIGEKYISDIVYGANDGIVTTFSIVSAVTGANLVPIVVLILGVANLLADGFSMAASDYLATTSQQKFRQSRIERIGLDIERNPVLQGQQLRAIYEHRGFEGETLEHMVEETKKNKNEWINAILSEEKIYAEEGRPIVKAEITFVSFVFAGLLPLVPYTFGLESALYVSIAITFAFLFVFGSLRSVVTRTQWWRNGLEMLAVGALAAGVAYYVGYTFDRLLP